MEGIWERDKSEPYYQGKPKGAEGLCSFLMDYSDIANKLFRSADCDKIPIEISQGDWNTYSRRILDFLELDCLAGPKSMPPNGIYKNEALNLQLTIDRLKIIDPTGNARKLEPRCGNEYYVERLPVILRFDAPGQLVIAGEQITERWTALGTVYKKGG